MSFIDKIIDIGKMLNKEKKFEIDENRETLYDLTDKEILDTTDRETIEKFKHNVKLLFKENKKNRKIDRFAIIRDDIYFPYDYIWRVTSKNTVLIKKPILLTDELKSKYAFNKTNDNLLLASQDKMTLELDNMDDNKFKVSFYVDFCSTKSFSINTPFRSNFNEDYFTIIDFIDNFVSSGYGYLLSYTDSLIDVSHEGLKISDMAVILIEKNMYDNFIKNPKISEQLNKRRVIIYKGDKELAVNMVLTELHIMPSRMDNKYYEYDDEIETILDESLRKISDEHNILCDKNQINCIDNHFTKYLDNKNNDYNESMYNFIMFLKEKLPECIDLISESSLKDLNIINKLINKASIDKMISIIEEYNNTIDLEFKTNNENYINDRAKIDNNIATAFKSTNNIISLYFKDRNKFPIEIREEIEKNAILFFQGDSVVEQINACKNLSSIFTSIYNK